MAASVPARPWHAVARVRQSAASGRCLASHPRRWTRWHRLRPGLRASGWRRRRRPPWRRQKGWRPKKTPPGACLVAARRAVPPGHRAWVAGWLAAWPWFPRPASLRGNCRPDGRRHRRHPARRAVRRRWPRRRRLRPRRAAVPVAARCWPAAGPRPTGVRRLRHRAELRQRWAAACVSVPAHRLARWPAASWPVRCQHHPVRRQ